MSPAARDNVAASALNQTRPLIGITMGDPSGIGGEVIVKALADPDLRSIGRFVIYGLHDELLAAADGAGIAPFWFDVPHSRQWHVDTGVVVCDYPEFARGNWFTGRPSESGGRASLAFLDDAIAHAREGSIDALVTGPIHKVSWNLARCPFPGHTERLAHACSASRVTMAFIAGRLRVALASIHLPLFELRNHFTIGLVFQPIDLLHVALRDGFGIEHPRIAVAGLNPHAGEEGRFGDEEARIIEPAMQLARNSGIDVEGPFPADSLFTTAFRSRYDGIVAMYHDQGLIPVKMLAFHSAVNITLGLPIIRTSPDHGTAFDIAGTGAADAGSMSEAIRLACRLARQRRMSAQAATTTPAVQGSAGP
ncbi:MAG: 4-hydroxythreonine-4-phosphate dehydrogenase PdxA [Phycisphaerae bacterium]|nr:4-hydroxythreonine-4-phosphate dehydrogenase PdxA [Phycisphaerae bacterium]